MSYAGNMLGKYSGTYGGRVGPPLFRRYAFDSGMPEPQRQLLLDAVCSMLSRLSVQVGGYVKDIVQTTTEVKGALDDEGIGFLYDELKGQTPAIAVCTGSLQFIPKGAVDQWDGTLDVYVYILVNSMRSRTSRQSGDVVSAADPHADPGAFVILEHANMLIAGKKPFSPTGKELRPVAEQRISSDGTMELWQLHYNVGLTKSVNLKRDLTLELQSIETYSRLASQAVTDPALVETTTDLT